MMRNVTCIQLFRERLSDKVHATTPKGIVGGLSALFLRWLDTVFQPPDYQFLTLKNSPKT